MVTLPDARVAVPIQAHSSAHEEYWRTKFERGRAAQRSSAWAIWDDGRIAGIEAEETGEFTTLPLRATGKPIEVNARIGFSGSMQVDVFLDEEWAQPVLRSRAVAGDLRWVPLAWEQGDPESLAGKTIRLRFHIRRAKVFGIRGFGLELVSSYARK
jgi:hypothetical protein